MVRATWVRAAASCCSSSAARVGQPAQVFNHVRSWNYCNNTYDYASAGDFYRVHAEFRQPGNDIILYGSLCTADAVYHDDIKWLSATHTMLFVASHELGHVIDDLTGDLQRDLAEKTDAGKGRIERRATVYGTYFAQCAATLFQQQAEAYANVVGTKSPKSPNDRAYVECQKSRWKDAAAFIGKIRDERSERAERQGQVLGCVERRQPAAPTR